MTGATVRLIIAGSRTVEPTIEDIDREVAKIVLDLRGDHVDPREIIAEVISGRAHGSDKAGERWAELRGIPVHLDPITAEDIERHGKYLAPKMRNRRMAERGTHLIAFWDGHSGGTADMVCRMAVRHKPAHVVPSRPKRRRKPHPNCQARTHDNKPPCICNPPRR